MDVGRLVGWMTHAGGNVRLEAGDDEALCYYSVCGLENHLRGRVL